MRRKRSCRLIHPLTSTSLFYIKQSALYVNCTYLYTRSPPFSSLSQSDKKGNLPDYPIGVSWTIAPLLRFIRHLVCIYIRSLVLNALLYHSCFLYLCVFLCFILHYQSWHSSLPGALGGKSRPCTRYTPLPSLTLTMMGWAIFLE